MYTVYEDGNWSVVKVKRGKYILWLWLADDWEWCKFGTYRSCKAAVREIDEIKYFSEEG